MEQLTRRRFLGQAAAAGGATLVRPAALWGADSRAEPPIEMAIARWGSERQPQNELRSVCVQLTERAMAAVGGMSRFVANGDVVWIKPNMGWNRRPETAANTNPDVVATLVRLCLEAGAKKVKIGDHTCHEAKQCYRSSGIEVAGAEAGADIVYLDDLRFREVELGGQRLTTWPVYPEVIEADLVINVPIAKHHGLSRVTLAMKNYMGIVGGRRNAWHQDLATCLCDITAFMKPRLCVLDAVRVLTDHGPQGGSTADVSRLDTVAASTDIVALDAFGAELLAHDPADIVTVRAGEAAGLGRMDYRELSLKEVVVT